MSRVERLAWVASAVLLALSAPGRAQEQDFSVLRINEVIADNRSVPPGDVGGKFVDMVEIYNTGEVVLDIGQANPNQSLAISNTPDLPLPTALWTFPRFPGRILPGDSIVVFCDSNEVENTCEPHANFRIESDGTHPITLWGPVVDGTRRIIDQVWLPPLPNDVSFGRFPDGAGPAPVPAEETLETFVFYSDGMQTFGSCIEIADVCFAGQRRRLCRGKPNGPGVNLPPRIEREEFSTNSPAAGKAVRFTVRIQDDKDPTPPNIALAEIVFRVDGGPEQIVPLEFDAALGILTAADRGAPLRRWAVWTGEIPGQPSESVVEFILRVFDEQGASDTSPEHVCEPGVGPCSAFFGGSGCERDPSGIVDCDDSGTTGAHFESCDRPFRYTVGYVPPLGLVINEVLASQDGLYLDATERACRAEDQCPSDKLDCCKYRDDALEIHNPSAQWVDLSGLWLSQSPFQPRGWQFPEGSVIGPGEHLVVWMDDDGNKCPDPGVPPFEQPCFWECPDPTDPAVFEFHTRFELRAGGDYLAIYDREENGLGRIHHVEFRDQELNVSLQLIPDGDRNGVFLKGVPSLRLPNRLGFRRGDADGSCGLDIADAVYVLNYLFTGGETPSCLDAADPDDSGTIVITDPIFVLNFLFLGGREPLPPGLQTGLDPTDDALGTCVAPNCP